MHKIFWAGDSTVQTNYYKTYPMTGIGQVFWMFLKEGYSVENYARNGRSTRNFIAEGRLQKIEENIKEGDFLFIQFGHNDEKRDAPERYTEPFSSFMENLEIFIDAAAGHGAYPVLITPLECGIFEGGELIGRKEHLDYVAAVKRTAEKRGVPLVDLYGRSRAALQDAGEAYSRRWFMYFEAGEYPQHPEQSRDNAHLRYDGAVYFGAAIAEGLRELGGIYGEMIQ